MANKSPIKFNVLAFLIRLWPVLKATLSSVSDAMAKDSEGGPKITKEEAGDIAADILMALAPAIQDEVARQLVK